MKSYNVFLGLGSNVGERHLFLRQAIAELKKVQTVQIVAASPVYETDPFGVASTGKFLNAALEITTTLEPSALLSEVKAIERRIGRTPGEKWGPREIDIDILLYDGVIVRDETVQVPHPEIEKRKFVLVPLREIAPDLVHPISGMTMAELAKECKDTGRVVKTSYGLFV